MNAQQFKTLLNSLKACDAASVWADGKTLKETWETCDRADWLLWLVGKMADKPGWPAREQVVLAACDCAETALKFVPETEDRPRKCLEVVRAWVAGSATIDEVIAARNAAAASAAASAAAKSAAAASAAASAASAADAYAADACADAYAYDAYAAAYAAASAADAYAADAYADAYAAAYAAASAADAAADAYAADAAAAYAADAYAYDAYAARREARANALNEMADLVRKALAQFVPTGEGK